MDMQSLFVITRYYLSRLSALKATRGQGISEYLGLLIGLAVFIALVVIIIGTRLMSKANSSSW